MNFWSWKPLLAFNAAFLLYVLARGRGASRGDTARRCVGLGAAWSVGIAAVVIAAYLPSLGANFVHQDWTQRVNTENVSIAHLFFRPVADRSWRPVGFLSIWVDNQIFGPRLWGYHLQNIALHGLNAVLAGVLACALGLSAWAARFTALLFGLGAIRFEAVVWPGARFDLLATAFMMIAVLLFLRGAPWWSVTAAFVLAVMSKETGYSLLLVIPAVSFLVRGGAGGFGCQDAEGHPEQPAHAGSAGETACPTLAMSALGLGVCAAALIGVRFALYGSLGGLAGVFHFSARTVYLLLRNALGGSIFLINSIPHTAWQLAIIAAYFVVMISAARGIERRSALALFALTLLSAAPAITVIGWIQAGLEESRYLYWPSLWICMLLALVFEDRRALACAFLAVQTAGLLWNVEVYCDMSARIGAIAAQVRSDAGGRAVPLVQYGGVGASPDGVFPFGYDLMVRTQSALPGAAVQTCSAACSGGPPTALVYRWDERTRTLTRLRP